MWWFNGVSTIDEILKPIYFALMMFFVFCVMIFKNYHPDEIFMKQIGNRLGYKLMPPSYEHIESLALFRKSRSLSSYCSGVLTGHNQGYTVRLFYFRQKPPKRGGEGFTVLEYTLPQGSLTLLLLSKLSQFNYYANPSTLTPILDRITVNLGEEFTRHFTLHASKQSESEILRIFTPEVIKRIITDKSFHELGLEISGAHLYIFRYRQILDEQRMFDFHRTATTLAQMVLPHIDPK
jgi:hypothetical protein